MARIAIVGPGAIGGVMAGWLARGGAHDVTLCARRPISELVVETPEDAFTIRPRVVLDPATAPAVDWVLVATKTYDAAGAAAWFERLCAEGAPVAVLQNGVEHRERFARWLPASRVLPVLAYCPAERSSPTRVHQRRKSWLHVPDEPMGRDFAELFVGTAIDVVPKPDFRTAAWEKLCLNAAGALNALLLEPAGIFRSEEVARVAREIMREGIAIGRAEGVPLDDALIDRALEIYRRNPPDTINSLHADRVAGRRMEIDARNGVIVRLGRTHGVPTPLNAMIVSLLEGVEAK